MRIFKSTYTEAGKKRVAKKFYVELRDHSQAVRRFSAFTDKAQSDALGRQIERLVRFKVAGEKPDQQLSKWLEDIPDSLRKHLVRINLLDTARASGGKLLVKVCKEQITGRDVLADCLLGDFEQCLLAKGNTGDYVQTVITRAKNVIEGCKFNLWTDISASSVQKFG